MKWIQTKIKTPNIGYAVLIDESLADNGLKYGNRMNLFIDGYVKTIDTELYIPNKIVSIINFMYSKEIIHLIKTRTVPVIQRKQVIIKLIWRIFVFVN